MLPIYCISGLGADSSIFENLQIKGATLYPIRWEIPEKSMELPTYAQQLLQQIGHEKPVLLGVSFGGMLAVEMSKLLPVAGVIIVSSCTQRKEMPWLLRLAGKLQIHSFVPWTRVTRSKLLGYLAFDTQGNQAEKALKIKMLRHSPPLLLQRSVDMILRWKGEGFAANVQKLHIHGSKDKLLLPRYVQPDYWIKNGNHFIIWNQATKVSNIISQQLKLWELL